MIKIYGIKNCDTMKKAFAWLDAHGISYAFIDYKKSSVDETILKQAISQHGWDTVLNRRGTTWRKLPDEIKNSMDETTAIKAAQDNPSLIKRPLIETEQTIILGFNADQYAAQLKDAA